LRLLIPGKVNLIGALLCQHDPTTAQGLVGIDQPNINVILSINPNIAPVGKGSLCNILKYIYKPVKIHRIQKIQFVPEPFPIPVLACPDVPVLRQYPGYWCNIRAKKNGEKNASNR
jgi:hypothetical protein